MAVLRPLANLLFYPSDHFQSVSSFAGFGSTLLDANDEKHAWILRAPRPGNIAKLFCRLNTVTTGHSAVPFRLEGHDDPGSGQTRPNGSLIAADASGTDNVADSDDNTGRLVTLTTAPTVTFGQKIAPVYGGPGSGTINLNVANLGKGAYAGPYAMTYLSAAWGIGAQNAQVFGMEYSDGVWPHIPGFYPITGLGQQGLAESTNPDEYGTRLKLEFTGRACGWWGYTDFDNGDAYTAKLYNSNLDVLLSTAEAGSFSGSTAGSFRAGFFTDRKILRAGKEYFFALRSTGSTNLDIQYLECLSPLPQAAMGAFHGGKEWYQVSRNNDSGSFTTLNTRKLILGLIFDAIYG